MSSLGHYSCAWCLKACGARWSLVAMTRTMQTTTGTWLLCGELVCAPKSVDSLILEGPVTHGAPAVPLIYQGIKLVCVCV